MGVNLITRRLRRLADLWTCMRKGRGGSRDEPRQQRYISPELVHFLGSKYEKVGSGDEGPSWSKSPFPSVTCANAGSLFDGRIAVVPR